MSEKKVLITKSILTDVATTIRDREGSSELIKPIDFASHIANMSIGQQGAPVSSITITNKDKLKSVRPGFSMEIEVNITPPWEGWTFSCTSSNPSIISVSPVLNTNGKYEVIGVTESTEPVTITVSAGDYTDSVEIKCRDLFEPDLTQVLNEEQYINLSNIVKAGVANEYLKLGDELLIAYDNTTMPMRVIGFADATVKRGDEDVSVPAIQMEMKYGAVGTTDWATSGSVNYSASKLKAYIEGQVQTKFAADFLACLGETRVQFCTRSNTADVSYCKLFAPSMAELGVTNASYNTAQQASIEGPAFEYYQGATDAKRVKQAIDATGVAQNYWTRSIYSGGSSYFGYIFTSGAPNSNRYAYAIRAVAACNFIGTSA